MVQEIATLEQIKRNLLMAVMVKSQYLKVQDMIKTFPYIFQLTAQELLELRDQFLMLTQTEETIETVKPLQSGVRTFDESIKTALAMSSSRAEITTEEARKAFQVTSVVCFGMTYILPHAKKPEHLTITAANLQKSYFFRSDC